MSSSQEKPALAMLAQAMGQWLDGLSPVDTASDHIGEGIRLSYFPSNYNHPARILVGKTTPLVVVHSDADGSMKFQEATVLCQQQSATETCTAQQHQLVPPSSLQELQAQPGAEYLQSNSSTTGVPLSTARLVTSAVVRLHQDERNDHPGVCWLVQCKHQHFAFFCIDGTSSAKTNSGDGVALPIHTIKRQDCLDARQVPQLPRLFEEYGSLRFADDNTSVGSKPLVHVAATYDVVGSNGSGTGGSNESWLNVEFCWDGPCPSLSAPPQACPVHLRLRAVPDEKSSTRTFHREVERLQRLCAVVEHLTQDEEADVEDTWAQAHHGCTFSVSEEELDTKLDQFLQDAEGGDGTHASVPPPTSSSGRGDSSTQTNDARPLFSQRRALDLPDRVWLLIQDCGTFAQLREVLVAVFQAMRRGEIHGSVHPGSQTQMAHLVVACEKANRLAARTTAAHNQDLNALLTTLATDPAELLTCVIETGVLKLQRDLLENVLGLKLATERQLAPFLKCSDRPLDIQTEQLIAVLRAMDAAVLLRKAVDLPTPALSEVVCSVLSVFEQGDLSCGAGDVPEVSHTLPEFSAGASLLRKLCSGLEPAVWTAKLTHTSCPSRTYQFISATVNNTYLTSTEEDDAGMEDDSFTEGTAASAAEGASKFALVTAMESKVALAAV